MDRAKPEQGGDSCPELPDFLAKLIQTGVLATQATIQQQYVNVGGELKSIQGLPTADLVALRERLYKASRRYQNLSEIPYAVTLSLASLTALGIFSLMSYQRITPHTTAERVLLLFLVTMVTLPCWIAMYDMRRRNRLACRLAERRWADVAIELDSRPDAPQLEWPPTKAVQSIIRFLKGRGKNRATE